MAESEVKASVKIRFLISDSYANEDECSFDMKLCCKSCIEQNLAPIWVKEKDCLILQPEKRDVFVTDKFEGNAFDHLSKFKCVVISPRALHTCVTDGIQIPAPGKPIYSLAMNNMIVSLTSFESEEKRHLKKLITLMSGIVMDRLITTVTHLVVNCVNSAKYEKAVNLQIPVMTSQWVESSWEASKTRNVSAADKEFMAHTCPPFYGLVITCTNLARREKELVRAAVNANGGAFSGSLDSDKTKLLVANDTSGDKFKFAKLWDLPCVRSTWIHDSVKAGHALDTAEYELGCVRKKACSTPLDDGQHHPDLSTMSAAFSGIPHANKTHVNETINMSSISSGASASSASRMKVEYNDIVNNLDLREAKKAGNFLDGCVVYLSGFSPGTNEKLIRILNGGGATRYNSIASCVSHVLVGNHEADDMANVRALSHRPHVVTSDWLIESIKLRGPAPEAKYLYLETAQPATEPPSPSLKRSLQMLQPCEPIPFPSLDRVEPKPKEAPQMNLIPQYLGSAQKLPEEVPFARKLSPSEDASGVSADMSTAASFTQSAVMFEGLTFLVVGFDEESEEACMEMVHECGGTVVQAGFSGVPDYAVVPLQGATLLHAVNEVVTNIWLEDCLQAGERLPLQYYHQPIALPDASVPLQGCVIGMSSYGGKEREFLTSLAKSLGAIFQEVFARKDNREKNAVASTHLVCCEAGTPKHLAAIKWGKPTITHEWLLACLREGRRVEEDAFSLQATAKAVSSDKENDIAQPGIDKNNVPVEQVATRRSSVDKPAPVAAVMLPPVTPSTPVNAHYGFSQETPVRFPRLSNISHRTPRTPVVALGNVATPDTGSRLPYGNVATPETPYGLMITDNPSPTTRKRAKAWIDKQRGMEPFPQPNKKRRDSTPVSELKRKLWSKCKTDTPGRPVQEVNKAPIAESQAERTFSEEPMNAEKQPLGTGINTQLNQLNELLLASPSLAGNVPDEVNKLALRRPSLLDSPSPAQLPVAATTTTGSSKSPETGMKESQSDVIAWADHSRRNSEEPSSAVLSTPPKFMLTSVENCDRPHYSQIITSLGGHLSDDDAFDESATHLIGARLARSEKLLATIASGKWFLHTSYLDSCAAEGRFLPEELYEWGNPTGSLFKSLKPDSLEYKLAVASYRWRQQLTGKTTKAFTGMRAIVHTGHGRSDALKRLIVAGGGSIEEAIEPYSEPGLATVCITEPSKTKTQIDFQALVEKNVLCLPPIFLNNYLVYDPKPIATDCLIPQYKELWLKHND